MNILQFLNSGPRPRGRKPLTIPWWAAVIAIAAVVVVLAVVIVPQGIRDSNKQNRLMECLSGTPTQPCK